MDKSGSYDFLIAEYNALQQRAMQIEGSRATVTNLYLVIVGASLAGLPSFIQMPFIGFQIIVVVIILFIVFVAGLVAYEYAFNQAVVATIMFLGSVIRFSP